MKGLDVVLLNAFGTFEMLTNTLFAVHTAMVSAEPLDRVRVKAWTREMLLFKDKLDKYLEAQDEGI
ncbi:MAG: hypothetical protein WCY84_00185 [Candidatus Cloacimonadaceae bacterium]